MNTLDSIVKKAKVARRKIVLSEGEDPRVVEAAVRAKRMRLAEPVLIGNENNIKHQITSFDANPESFEIIEPEKSSRLAKYASHYAVLRKNRPISTEEARTKVIEPLNFAAMMVKMKDADGTIGGAVATTSETVSTAMKIIGKADGINTVSSFFLIILDKPYHPKNTALIFSDCGLVIEPTVRQLTEIAKLSVLSFGSLVGVEPKVAMLSFSTRSSARHKRVRHVMEATALLKKMLPNIKIDGELQFDSAFVPSVSARKSNDSPLQGDANIMVFPNLDAANIGYKIAERLGGARAIGPILQGLSRPANDLSRGCSVEDICDLMAVTAVQVDN